MTSFLIQCAIDKAKLVLELIWLETVWKLLTLEFHY